MGLKRRISRLDDVPAQVRQFYRQDEDGSFVIDLDGEDERVKELQGRNEQLTEMFYRSRMVNRVNQALKRNKIQALDSAMEDIMMRADEIFNGLSENGEPVAIGPSEEVDPEKTFDWFVKTLSEDAPHLFGEIPVSGPKTKTSPKRGNKSIDPNDPKSMGKDIDAIASGKLEVDFNVD